MENENSRMNNLVNRRNHQYQEIIDINKNVPKPIYYMQNPYNNNLNKNNFINNFNNLEKQNLKDNANMNANRIKINTNNNVNRNNNNNKKIQINLNSGQNFNINRAIVVIKNEFRKKDEKIKKLELKISELENKINMLLKENNLQQNYYNNNSRQNNYNRINLEQNKIGNNFILTEKYSGEINQNYIKKDCINNTPDRNNNRPSSSIRNYGMNGINQNNNNNMIYSQTNSVNQNKNRGNIKDDVIYERQNSIGNNDKSVEGTMDGSIFTGNSSNFQRHSKVEVKLYLKEVKSKVDPIIFKEFIQNIKLLTNSKNKNGIDKKSVIERVKILFGEQFKDLFIKFESIIGFNPQQ